MSRTIAFRVACIGSVIGLSLCSARSLAGEGDNVAGARSDFARDVLSGRASILIVGDSTNNPSGAGIFVPYYESLLRRLPTSVPVSGFRISGSPGGLAVGGYVNFVGGSTAAMVGGALGTHDPTIAVSDQTNYVPPGVRNDFTVLPGASLPSGGRFVSLTVEDLSEICPAGVLQWPGRDLVIRTPIVVGPGDAEMLQTFDMQTLTDFDGVPGGFDASPPETIETTSVDWGLRGIDIVYKQVPSLRFGLRMGGDHDPDDGDEGGRTFSWLHHTLFDQQAALSDRGLYLDSISVGGFSASTHASTLQQQSLRDYVALSPRTPNWIVVWLGQNMTPDEWNGSLRPIFFERLQQITDLAIDAALAADPDREVRVAIVVPPQVSGVYPSVRFTAMQQQAAVFAADRGWAFLDLFGTIGTALADIDPSYSTSGIHPRLGGSEFVADVWYEVLECARADMNGDGLRNFFDVSDYLAAFGSSDLEADFDGDRDLDFFDISAFLAAFSAVCP